MWISPKNCQFWHFWPIFGDFILEPSGNVAEMAKIPKLPDFTVSPDLDVDFPKNCQFWRFDRFLAKNALELSGDAVQIHEKGVIFGFRVWGLVGMRAFELLGWTVWGLVGLWDYLLEGLWVWGRWTPYFLNPIILPAFSILCNMYYTTI